MKLCVWQGEGGLESDGTGVVVAVADTEEEARRTVKYPNLPVYVIHPDSPTWEYAGVESGIVPPDFIYTSRTYGNQYTDDEIRELIPV